MGTVSEALKGFDDPVILFDVLFANDPPNAPPPVHFVGYKLDNSKFLFLIRDDYGTQPSMYTVEKVKFPEDRVLYLSQIFGNPDEFKVELSKMRSSFDFDTDYLMNKFGSKFAKTGQ